MLDSDPFSNWEDPIPEEPDSILVNTECLPRRPGVYPDRFPIDCYLRRAPTPGEPLSPEEQCSNLIASLSRRSGPIPYFRAPVETDRNSKLWRALTARAPIQSLQPMAQHSGDFPPIDCLPPKLPLKPRTYPSGNATGTAEWGAFEGKLKELLVQGDFG
jgi:hypothetical protein